VDAIPLVLATQDPDEIIKVVEAIAPTFGGINLEDIAAPNCFYIETELKKRLNIPVFHDDQHGTAIVVLAGLINALKLKGNATLSDQKIIISGAGAAAIAIGKLLHQAGATNIIFADSKGLISSARKDLNPFKQELLPLNFHDVSGTLQDALQDADVFIGVSKGGILKADDVRRMAPNPIIFALANPTPEIMPEEAKAAGAFIVATGRSDFPNQVNNVLAFPGIFRGALDAKLPQITAKHKITAAQALATYITNPDVEHILPSALDKGVAKVIAKAVTLLKS
jgi:malate dehydrogenase (oxaloacetate-decarboxylating)